MPPQQTAVPLPVKIGKFKASHMIVSQSWALLKQDKEIMLFPVLSTIVSFLALIAFGVLYVALFLGGAVQNIHSTASNQVSSTTYIFILLYYIVMAFILNFFQSGIYIIAHGRFNGQNLTLSDGLNGAFKHIGKILVWSAISATVGLILRIIADRSKLVGKIIAMILGAAWNILTYFSLPSIVIGNRSIGESFKESASVIRKTWGETIIINFGVGLFFFILIFAGFALSVGIMVLIPKFLTFAIVIIALVAYVIILSIISSSLNSIFKLALYEYATTGNVPHGFSPELIKYAIQAK